MTRDADVYIEKARAKGVRIAAVIGMHIHVDFGSGARELAARTGATIYGGKSNEYQFELKWKYQAKRLKD